MAQLKKISNKKCFLITPIGSPNDDSRVRVDQWMNLIYKPAINNEYQIIRADQYQVPGVITEQIIQLIIDAELVVIDYTGLNPNVMYEAAIRHLVGKPFIQIHPIYEKLPFDIHNLRSISYDPKNLDYPKKLINDLKLNLKIIANETYEQPMLVKEKFNFDKIISDPEKFVSLLTKSIAPYNVNKKDNNENIVTIPENYSYHSMPLMSTKIVCPKCGTIKYQNNNYSEISIPSFFKKHYKCNVCGTEFESN